MEILSYERFYRMFGVRIVGHIMNPRVINVTDVIFPRNTMVHYYRGYQSDIRIKKEGTIFNNVENALVYTKTDYDNSVLLKGKYVKVPKPAVSIIAENAKNEPEFKFIKLNQTITVPDKVLKITDYSYQDASYKYMEQIFKRTYMVYNGLASVLKNCLNRDRRHMIFLDMPDELLRIPEYVRNTKDFTKERETRFLNYRYFIFFELWKYIQPKERTKSVFSIIPYELTDNIDLLLHHDGKVVIINLKKLIHLVKYKPTDPEALEDIYRMDMKFETGIPAYNTIAARRLFYIMILKFVKHIATTSKEIDLDKVDDETINEEIETEEVISDNVIKEDELEEISTKELELDTTYNEEEVSKKTNTEDDESDVRTKEDDDLELLDDNKDLELEEDDSLIEKVETNTNNNLLNLTQNVIFKEPNYDNVISTLQALKDSKIINSTKQTNIENVIKKSMGRKSTLIPNMTVKDVLDYSKDNYRLTKEEAKITSTPAMLVEGDNYNTTKQLASKYLKEQYKKDITRVLYSVQNSNTVVEEHTVTPKLNILGGVIEHTLKIKSINPNTGEVKNGTIKINLPNLLEDGAIYKDGNRYRLRGLRVDLPIRKIDYNNVALTSYYGKLFVIKGSKVATNTGSWILRKLKASEEVAEVIIGENENTDVKLPLIYSLLARHVKLLRIKDNRFSFDYHKRNEMLPDYDLTKIEKDSKVLVGTNKRTNPILIDNKNKFYLWFNNNYKEIDNPLDVVGINLNDAPIEFATIKVMKETIPVGIILLHYNGLNNLLKYLGCKYTEYPRNKRIPIIENHFILKFGDKQYLIERDYNTSDMVLGGLVNKNDLFKDLDTSKLQTMVDTRIILERMGLSKTIQNELTLLETMFIDPITLTVLKEMNEPTNFQELVLRACDMLTDDSYHNPNDISEARVEGYERIAGMVYKELSVAIRNYENTSSNRKSFIDFKPYSIIDKIRNDSSSISVDDLNPMAGIKQYEEVTQVGDGGRSKEGMSRETRIMDKTEVGFTSEGVKDSTDVGIAANITANPNMESIRGLIKTKDVEDMTWSELVSTTAMTAPMVLKDDPRRTKFSAIMFSHIIPINKPIVPYIRTGYENIIPIKAEDRYCITAEDIGVVTTITKNKITVKYKNLGVKTYSYSDWTTKEESGGCYTMPLIPNVKVGSKVRKDDTLVYNPYYFQPDVFDPARVVFKQGAYVNVALTEDLETYEDSAEISSRLSEVLGNKETKVISKVFMLNDNIFNLVPIGSKVEADTPLYSKADPIAAGMDNETKKMLLELNKYSPTPKVNGIVKNIVCYYIPSKEITASKTMRDVINDSNARLMSKYGYTGEVTTEYSVNGKPLQPGEVQIKVYVEAEEGMGIGDKAIFGNQLKFTVGNVFEYDIKGEDGTPVDAMFSMRSIAARIVNSPMLIGTTATILDKVAQNAVDMYFKKINK